MAVFIKQSPPREGVRGGWEDFNWESLKSQSHADRDYYLGASAKVGICTRGKFEKFDWWTKKKENREADDAAEEELRRVKRFEQQLLDEALGKKPRMLLAGEALPEEEPLRPVAAPEAADAARALKKLKKEQKRLKKLRKKEQKREARRAEAIRRERRSNSPTYPLVKRSRSSSKERSREERSRHSRRHHRRSRSPPHDSRSRSTVRVKRDVSEDEKWFKGQKDALGRATRDSGEKSPEADLRKRRHSRSPERNHHKRSRRSSSPRRERQRERGDEGRGSSEEGRHREKSGPRKSGDRRRGDWNETSHRRRLPSSEAGRTSAAVRDRDVQRDGDSGAHRSGGVKGDLSTVKLELLEKERTTESSRNCRSHRDMKDGNPDWENVRVKTEKSAMF